uniref:Uncharacterized protein n=1 Tax=Triticum urartu TaxID=4572 RepID=A0A8R7TUY3_TRIUA
MIWKYQRPKSVSPMWLHADRMARKVMSFGATFSLSIRRNISTASKPRPCKANPAINVVQVTMLFCPIPSNTSTALATHPHLRYMSIMAFISRICQHNPRFTTNLCTHSPKSTAPRSPQADSTDSIAIPSGSMPSTCILRNTSTASAGRFICAYAPIKVVHDTTFLCGIASNSSRAQTRFPDLTYPEMVTFQQKMSLWTVSSNTLRAEAAQAQEK